MNFEILNTVSAIITLILLYKGIGVIKNLQPIKFRNNRKHYK